MMRRRALLPWNAPLAGMLLLWLDWLLVVIRPGEPCQSNWLYRGRPLWKSSANADLTWKLPISKPPSAEPLVLSLQAARAAATTQRLLPFPRNLTFHVI